MMRVWLALGVFVGLHLLAFIFVFLAARHVKPGARSGSMRYLFFGEPVARDVLTEKGLRLASIAKTLSWIAFAISACILVFF